MTRARKIKRPGVNMTAEEWNAKYKVGTDVTYWPVVGRPELVRATRTRSEAWTLGDGVAVVSVDDVSGGVSVEHLVLR